MAADADNHELLHELQSQVAVAERYGLVLLANMREALGSLDRIERILKVGGFVASAPGFNDQPKVLDAASNLLGEIFGEAGRHARSAIGVAELPRNAAVEIEMTVAYRE